MKKAWKWCLALVAVPALCVVLLVLDSCARASSAITNHEARLANDIAEFRTNPRTAPAEPASPSPLFRPGKGVLPAFEQGHSGQEFLSDRVDWDYIRLAGLSSPSSAEPLLTALAIVTRDFRGGGYSAFHARCALESDALQRLGVLLAEGKLPAQELRRVSAALDQLLLARPTCAEAIRGEHLLDKTEILGVLHHKTDPYCMIRISPGVGEFYSWSILTAKILLQMDDQFREVRELEARPSPEREEASARWVMYGMPHEAPLRTSLRGHANTIFSQDRAMLSHWRLTRIAAALTLFQAENGRTPRELGELIPGSFAELPVSPWNGKPFEYHDGILQTPGANLSWSRRPRGK